MFKPLILTLILGIILLGALMAFWKQPSFRSPDGVNWGMKLVNETVTDAELDRMADMGITILGGEWGMAEATPDEFRNLLDRVHARNMKFIVNFSDEAGWGYTGAGDEPENLAPVWQGERVKQYLRDLGDHPAIYGFDISNEAGENLPNRDRFRITLDQMRTAAADVRSVNGRHPVILRMHDWDENDEVFGESNPFGSGIADIVMLNIYSNYTQNGQTPFRPGIVSERGQALIDAVKQIDPNAEVSIALGVFRELPRFVKPEASDLRRDIQNALALNGIKNIYFFGWGPERYPDTPPGWYLPRDGQDLLNVIQEFTLR